jgi:ATP-dependent DNA helicase DinG
MRAAIRLAGGREVCFVCTLDEDAVLRTARVAARGDVQSVLALPGFAQPGEMLVHNHPSGVLDPSEADYEVAARIHPDGIGFGIIDNEARELYVVVEVPTVDPETPLELQPSTPISVRTVLIARLLPKYEDRPAQRELARRSRSCTTRAASASWKPGTGIGKSLGYLVPALRWAAANGERTVVSTNTINLQEQLVGKDLPFLERALADQKVRFALLKGWRNYLCLMRLEQARSTGMALFEESLGNEIAAISSWAERTADGSLSDLPAPPRAEVWDEISAEPDLCTRVRCAHYDKCFLFAARRRAAQADVIVVNHHLLMSDVAVRRVSQNWEDSAVLPAYARLVVDEGHHMEDAAAAHLGATVTRRSLQRLFARLDRTGKGILPALMMRLAEGKDLLSAASLDLAATKLQPACWRRAIARGSSSTCWLQCSTKTGVPVMRLTDDFRNHRVWRAGLDLALTELLAKSSCCMRAFASSANASRPMRRGRKRLRRCSTSSKGIARRLQNGGDAVRRTLRPAEDAEAAVRWIEGAGKEKNLVVTSVPLDLAPCCARICFAACGRPSSRVRRSPLNSGLTFSAVASDWTIPSWRLAPRCTHRRLTFRATHALPFRRTHRHLTWMPPRTSSSSFGSSWMSRPRPTAGCSSWRRATVTFASSPPSCEREGSSGDGRCSCTGTTGATCSCAVP